MFEKYLWLEWTLSVIFYSCWSCYVGYHSLSKDYTWCAAEPQTLHTRGWNASGLRESSLAFKVQPYIHSWGAGVSRKYNLNS